MLVGACGLLLEAGEIFSMRQVGLGSFKGVTSFAPAPEMRLPAPEA